MSPASEPQSVLPPAVAWDGPRVYRRTVGSTMDLARDLARAGCPGRTLVLADVQSAGRGRQGRAWVAPPGGALALSVVFRPLPPGFERIPFACAVAAAEAVEEHDAPRCGIKWPNDVLIGGRKVAGTIVESRIAEGWAVAGIGMNVNVRPEELPVGVRETATSLSQVRGRTIDRSAVLESLLRRLVHWTERLDRAASLFDELRSRDVLAGMDITWQERGGRRRGKAAGVADSGCLRVVEPGGLERDLASGEVHLAQGN